MSSILIVDDNADMRQYVRKILDKEPNWRISEVANGKAALDRVRVQPPDMILSDVMMPIMNGFQLISNLKMNSSTASIPVILLSGRSGDQGKVEGLDAGADDYLVKPFSAQELLARVRTQLKIGRFRSSLERKVRRRTLELINANEEIVKSETRYRTLSVFSPVGILHTDLHGNMQYVNEQFLKIVGLDNIEDASRKGWRRTIPPEYDQILNEWFETPHKTKDLQFKLEIQFLNQHLHKHWGLLQSEPIMDQHQPHISGYVFAVSDITERKNLDKERMEIIRKAEAIQLKRARDAERHQRQQERFVDMICHEIRNPLNGIINNVDLLLSSVKDRRNSPAQSESAYKQLLEDEEATEAIKVCAQHQLVITNDVLLLSKLEAGLVHLNKTPFDPVLMTRSVVGMFSAEARSKNINISFEFSPEMKNHQNLIGDPNRISQVLINLLSNAVKFTSNSLTREIFITVSLFQQQLDVFLKFSVKDTGLGMTEEEQSNLFKRFSQVNTKSPQLYEGSGLGLFLSKSFVTAMSGEMTVRSSPLKGSEFSFTVKTEIVQMPTTECPKKEIKTKQYFSNLERAQKDRKILIVEDNTVNQRVLQRHLTSNGYSCKIASNGLEAVQLFEANWVKPKNTETPFDLVFMDMEMPVMGGLEAVGRIRALERERGHPVMVPIVGLSGNAREIHINEGLAAGMQMFLTKPYQKDQLLKTAQQLISQFDALRHLGD
eukprot:TRINITY_DN5010_c0_g4_i1.p1 TRINITY_DN5010_c0_g4~~TRINITY_DN5010_c0_g4_i1.p1  ORF type:complete len:718 (-),score=121.17 TRINITY_DN5010_c0_g4_i1:64-2217(-)